MNVLGLKPEPWRPATRSMEVSDKMLSPKRPLFTCLLFPYPVPPRLALGLGCLAVNDTKKIQRTYAVERDCQSGNTIDR